MVEHEDLRTKLSRIRDAVSDLDDLLGMRIEGIEVELTEDQKEEIDARVESKIDEIRNLADDLDRLK